MVAAIAVACAEGPVDLATGVAVEVRRGPIAPVGQPGVDNTAPVRGAIIVVYTESTQFGGVITDAVGKGSVPVPPGDYEVAVTTCPGALGPPSPVSVRVVSGSLSPVGLVCDTGIR